jgi:NodT family efflux transporter outer membrane factor (OMF) lipoprotein
VPLLRFIVGMHGIGYGKGRAMPPSVRNWLSTLAVAALAFSVNGCTGPIEYIRNGLKVGPNYHRPDAPTATQWIDASDARVRQEPTELVQWWSVFHDPELDRLIDCASRQNLTLREAGFRILAARCQLAIKKGDFFPQVQGGTGSYQKSVNSGATAETSTVNSSVTGTFTPNGKPPQPGVFDGQGNVLLIPPVTSENITVGMNLAWEIDFWGRFRRAVVAAEDTLDANCADYNGAMVTLLGDVAKNYVQLRTDQKRIELARANAVLQRRVMEIALRRYREGQTNDLDYNQARSTLAQTEAQIPLLLSDLREAEVRLCVLMGMPPAALESQLGIAPIPTVPTTVVVGIPADLLRRRPDVCRAERLAAAQAEQIGIAEADLYPAFKINGDMGYASTGLASLFETNAFYAAVGPGVQWNILNYGRIRNNVKLQDAKFQELVTTYQRMVLQAAEEAEIGMSHFLQEQDRAMLLDESVSSLQLAVKTVVKQYEAGGIDLTRVEQIEQNLVQQQDAQASSHGQVAQGLIEVYRALGGGWRCPAGEVPPEPVPPPAAPVQQEAIPIPPPEAPRPIGQ